MFTANKFLIATQAAIGVAVTVLAPYVTGLQLAFLAIFQAFVGAFGVYQVSNPPKAPDDTTDQ